MGAFGQEGFAYRFDWGVAGARSLAPGAGAVVVVDVLSFSTCVDVALAAGAEVVPAAGHDEDTAELARRRGSVVAARIRSLAAPSLSPSSLRRLTPGTRLVLPSPNGAAVALAAAGATAGPVFAACFRNARAVAEAARRAAGSSPVVVLAAGERWPDESLRAAVEDQLAAGAILAALDPAAAASGVRCSPEAGAARAAFVAARPRLAELLRECASARQLAEQGFASDVELALEVDVSPLAPRLERGAFVFG